MKNTNLSYRWTPRFSQLLIDDINSWKNLISSWSPQEPSKYYSNFNEKCKEKHFDSNKLTKNHRQDRRSCQIKNRWAFKNNKFDRQTPRDPHRSQRDNKSSFYASQADLPISLQWKENTSLLSLVARRNHQKQLLSVNYQKHTTQLIITGYFWFILRFYNNIKKKK